MGTSLPLRPVRDDEVEAFWRDGVVCLRGILPADVVVAMEGPVERTLTGPSVADLSGMGELLERDAGAERTIDAGVGGSGRFRAGTDHWLDDADFRAFAVESPLGPIVATLLRSERVLLYEDSVLVKEPGTAERTAFHQDMAYFHLQGDQVCTTWVPLDAVDATSGAVRFVVGSHLDRTAYRPNLFVTTMALPGTEGATVPDHFDPEVAAGLRIVSFDTEPGDLTVHHARTIHGADANGRLDRRRRAISVRYAGDDVVHAPRPGAPAKAHHAAMRPGEPLDPAVCPPAWPR